MSRAFLQVLLPFLVPFVAYGIYAYIAQRRQAEGGPPPFESVPWVGLAGAGAVLAALAVGLVFFLGGEEPGKEYVPPRYIDGEIVPGEFKDRDEE